MPAKRDSLTRSAAARGFVRKGTGSLQRQSLVQGRERDSISSESGGGYAQSPVEKGVQLEDKPMDFD